MQFPSLQEGTAGSPATDHDEDRPAVPIQSSWFDDADDERAYLAYVEGIIHGDAEA